MGLVWRYLCKLVSKGPRAAPHASSSGAHFCDPNISKLVAFAPVLRRVPRNRRGARLSSGHNFQKKGYTLDGAHEQCTGPLNHVYSESSSSSAFPFSGKAGTPLGQASPCLWTGTYFFKFSQSCNLRAFTGTHPSLRGIAHRPSVVRSTRSQGMASLYPDFNHT